MNTELVGRDYKILPEVTSTNTAVKELNQEQELPEGFCLLSDYQTSGRGQYGKQWDSEPGQNLLMSLLLRPVFLSASESYRLTMSVCLALHDLGLELGFDSYIKWPNDWFYGEQKIAGVLAESSLRGSRMENCIVGIGINVRQKKFPHPQATSLSKIIGQDLEVQDVFEKLAVHLDNRYQQLRFGQYQGQHCEFESILYGRDQWVPVLRDGQKLRLRCEGVNPGGELKVTWQDGRQETLQHQSIRFVF